MNQQKQRDQTYNTTQLSVVANPDCIVLNHSTRRTKENDPAVSSAMDPVSMDMTICASYADPVRPVLDRHKKENESARVSIVDNPQTGTIQIEVEGKMGTGRNRINDEDET